MSTCFLQRTRLFILVVQVTASLFESISCRKTLKQIIRNIVLSSAPGSTCPAVKSTCYLSDPSNHISFHLTLVLRQRSEFVKQQQQCYTRYNIERPSYRTTTPVRGTVRRNNVTFIARRLRAAT
ncbi:unnamed protein product [Ixodes pacificus]